MKVPCLQGILGLSKDNDQAYDVVLGRVDRIGRPHALTRGTVTPYGRAMQIKIDRAPYAVRVLPAIQYGTAAGLPGDSGLLLLDVWVPDAAPSPRPVVLYICSEGWESRSPNTRPWISPLLAAHGFVAASASHRRGDIAPFPAQLHDVKAAVRWLRTNASAYGIDPDRFGVWGDSAGGHLAALLGTTAEIAELEGNCGSGEESSAVQAVLVRCAPADLRVLLNRPYATERMGKLFNASDRDHWIDAASPTNHARPGLPPFLIVHGTNDEVAPYESAANLAAALQEQGNDVTLHTIQGGHHNLRDNPSLPWTDEPWEALGYQALDFFHRHLSR